MRVFVGGILTETNSFSPIPIGMGAFESAGIVRSNHLQAADSAIAAVSRAAHAAAADLGWTIIEGLLADAQPGGPVRQDVYEQLRDELLSGIEAALPLDIVLLNLHGGMVAFGYDDCEGDLIARVRSLVGAQTVIGAEMDPHSHLSDAMVENATVLCCYKENPHIDISARATDLVRLCADAAAGRTHPHMSVFDCRMADVFQTNREPMKSFVDRMRALEGRDGVLDISIVHGFRRADIPIMGAKVIVITNNDPERGAQLAQRLGRELFAIRGTAAGSKHSIDEAIDCALAAKTGPVILADMADNPGGGAPGDSTYILDALLQRGVRDIAVGYMVDPLAVELAFEAGVGATLQIRIGGKLCHLSGRPLDFHVRVKSLIPDAHLRFPGGSTSKMGRAVALEADGVEFALITERVQTYAPSLFDDLGIEISSKRVVVVKSAQHYQAFFAGRFSEHYVVDAPGVCIHEIRDLPFTRIKRPMWPFDADPFGTGDA